MDQLFKLRRAGNPQPDNVVVATMWIVPYLFWPIASTADFFGQWNNSFMWSALAIALAGAQLGDEGKSRAHR